mmetsp:Transcript_28187/g.59537  ORF Transcript_28187/g.59537 Transcript_28187/m.59537 type:complete len:124 (+) Transcript_28187:21-392(+)
MISLLHFICGKDQGKYQCASTLCICTKVTLSIYSMCKKADISVSFSTAKCCIRSSVYPECRTMPCSVESVEIARILPSLSSILECRLFFRLLFFFLFLASSLSVDEEAPSKLLDAGEAPRALE